MLKRRLANTSRSPKRSYNILTIPETVQPMKILMCLLCLALYFPQHKYRCRTRTNRLATAAMKKIFKKL